MKHRVMKLPLLPTHGYVGSAQGSTEASCRCRSWPSLLHVEWTQRPQKLNKQQSPVLPLKNHCEKSQCAATAVNILASRFREVGGTTLILCKLSPLEHCLTRDTECSCLHNVMEELEDSMGKKVVNVTKYKQNKTPIQHHTCIYLRSVSWILFENDSRLRMHFGELPSSFPGPHTLS